MLLNDDAALALASDIGVHLLSEHDRIVIGSSTFYRVKLDAPYETYIVDSSEGRALAAKPELVGEDFLETNYKLAESVAELILRIEACEQPIVFLHILRGSLGYQLHKALRKRIETLYETYIRPRYLIGGYGDHTDRRLKVVFRRFEALDAIDQGVCTLVVADTVATGNTLHTCLKEMSRALKARNIDVETLVLYGFISKRSLEILPLSSIAKRILVIAIEDYTALAANNYDMPLYGVDVSKYELYGKLQCIGGYTVLEVFKRIAGSYAPGLDQPGDWSERQPTLPTGYGWEKGDIVGHLLRSLKALEKARALAQRMPWYRDWMDDVYKERKNAILRALKRYGYSKKHIT